MESHGCAAKVTQSWTPLRHEWGPEGSGKSRLVARPASMLSPCHERAMEPSFNMQSTEYLMMESSLTGMAESDTKSAMRRNRLVLNAATQAAVVIFFVIQISTLLSLFLLGFALQLSYECITSNQLYPWGLK